MAAAAAARGGSVPPLNPRTTKYEWMGPVGSVFLVTSLPLTVLGLNAVCDGDSCALLDGIELPERLGFSIRRSLADFPTCFAIVVAWFVLHCLIYLAPIGSRVKGLPLRNGKTLTYNINGLHAFIFCHVAAAVGNYLGIFRLARIAELFFPLAVTAVLGSVVGSILLYAWSFRSKNVLLALPGNTGNMFYDFWVGRELNPRIGNLDLKFMCELRPGLIGWCLFNWAFVAAAWEANTMTPQIVLVALFQTWYVGDAMWFEAGNTSMMDIVHDGFGFMLCFGDHAWVPFLYTLQVKYMYLYPAALPAWYLAVFVALHFAGYTIFRGANSQKDTFRRDPSDKSVAHLHTMQTSAGKFLIVSGYWGVCRHPNYVGDWLMTVAWSALTGATLLPYFQPIYFAILLIHRQLRDEDSMLRKYGRDDWDAYCRKVPYRLIPYVY